MGNTIVTPSLKDWYTVPLGKQGCTIIDHLEAGNFFLVFKGKDSAGQDILIKAYEYAYPLNKLDLVNNFINEYNKSSSMKSHTGIVSYSFYFINDTMGFLVRPYMQKNLIDVAQFQQPVLTNIEKAWISYQLLSNLLDFHKSGLIHGDIKPSNVFVNRDLSVFLTDIATFKPDFVDLRRPMVYYHFFTSNTNSAFYLAPERISNIQNPDQVNENNQNSNSEQNQEYDKAKADLFSLGCTIAFLYLGGKHVFDILSIQNYIQNDYDIRSILDPYVENKEFLEFLLKLLSINPDNRSFTNDYLDSLFPAVFPLFYHFVISVRDNPSNPWNKIKSMVISFFQGKSSDEKLLGFIWLSDYLISSFNLDIISDGFIFLNDFVKDFDDFTKLERVLPVFLNLLEFPQTKCHRIGLFSALTLIRSIKSLPSQFSTIFDSYLLRFLRQIFPKFQTKPEIRRYTISSSHAQSTVKDPNKIISSSNYDLKMTENKKDAMIILDFLPKIVVEMKRLKVPSFETYPSNFSVLLTYPDYSMFKVFFDSLNSVSAECGYKVFSSFLYLTLPFFNDSDHRFSSIIFEGIVHFYNSASLFDQLNFKKQFQETLIPIIINILSRNPEGELLFNILSFVEFLLSKQICHSTFSYEIFQYISSYLTSNDPKVLIIISRIIKLSDPDVREYYFIYQMSLQNNNNQPVETNSGSRSPKNLFKNKPYGSITFSNLFTYKNIQNQDSSTTSNNMNSDLSNQSSNITNINVSLSSSSTNININSSNQNSPSTINSYNLSNTNSSNSINTNNNNQNNDLNNVANNSSSSSINSNTGQNSPIISNSSSSISSNSTLNNMNVNNINNNSFIGNTFTYLTVNSSDTQKRTIHLRPKFLCSQLLIDPSNSHVTGVSHLLDLHNSSILAIDYHKRLRFMTLSPERLLYQQATRVLPEYIVSAETLPESESFILGYSTGGVFKHMVKRRNSEQIQSLNTLPVNFIKNTCDNVVVLGYNDGTLLFDDMRTNTTVQQCKLDVAPICDICSWPNGVAIGVASSPGVFTMLDMRMQKPLWFTVTPPLSRVFPLPPRSYAQKTKDSMCLGAIYQNGTAAIMEQPSGKVVETVYGENMFGFEFYGHALFIDDDSCQLINIANPNLSARLYDPDVVVRLETKRTNVAFFQETGSTKRPGSLHKHIKKITSVLKCGNMFVSGDESGLVNCWQVSDP